MRSIRPTGGRGFVASTRFVHPNAVISTHNYPRPSFGNTYVTNNTTIINNNYNYDAGHYSPHVVNFYGHQNSLWGDRWRYGCQPSPLFSASAFGFGFYVYTPFYAPCVPSPYYYDPYVPAYFPEARVAIWSGYNCDWNDGDSYDYVSSDAYDSYGDVQFNFGISTISACYSNRNVGVIADVCGSGDVAVFADGRYEYSLNDGDFRAMWSDHCRACRTVSFDIVSCRHRDGYGVVRYRHRFRDWRGGEHIEYIGYHLRLVGDRYCVTDFMTSGSSF